MYTILENAPQGSDAWLAARAARFGASEAAAAMGVSKYTTRSALLKQKATGLREEVSPEKQRLFDAGHAAEAAARSIAEQIIGEELAPLVATLDYEGLPLIASFDGIDFVGESIWENKLLSQALVDQIAQGDLDPHYWSQLEHALLVSGADRALFTTSDGTAENTHHLWYRSVPERRAQVVAAWKQFQSDLAAYVLEPSEPPKPTGRAPESMPALRIEVTGSVTASNLSEFKASALAVLGGINRNLQTDADFADAEQTVKWCGDVESRIKAAKENALAQTASIEEAFRVMDDVSAEVRRVRLDLDKLVKAEKDARRMAIVRSGSDALQAHIKALNERLGSDLMPAMTADFGGAAKGLKSLDSMKDAIATALANAKIEASAVADRIQANLTELRSRPDMVFLFPDTRSLVQKAPDDLRAVMAARIAEHQAKERARQEDDRERIRAEEQAKAETAALERALAQPHAVTPQPEPQTFAAAAPAANEPPPDTGARMTLGQINTRIAPLSITVAGLNTLGFQHVGKDKAAFLFSASDFALICEAIAKRVLLVRADYLGDAARVV